MPLSLFLVLHAFHKALVLSNEDDMLGDSFDNCPKDGPVILTPLGGAQINQIKAVSVATPTVMTMPR
jgi:hypothetical protein